MTVVLTLLLCFLFAVGLVGSGAFAATRWGVLVRDRLVPVYLWLLRRPLWAFPIIVSHYLVALASLALVAAFPGGALWLAPVLGY